MVQIAYGYLFAGDGHWTPILSRSGCTRCFAPWLPQGRLEGRPRASPVALLAAAKDLCTCEVLLEHSPNGEPQANGEAERAVQSIMGLARTLKEHITTATGQPIPAESPILAWLVNYAGSLLTLFNRGPDGKTPYERL